MQPWYNFIVRTLYTILYYVLVTIFVHTIFIISLLRHKYSAPLSAPTQSVPAIASHGQTAPQVPMVALPFRAPAYFGFIPPPSHQHLIHSIRSHYSYPASNQSVHKSQRFLIRYSRYDAIRPIRYDTIQPIRYDPFDTIRYDTASTLF